jgi:hypothetical protein
LDLRVWIAAIFLVLTSSKGISSVVLSRILGMNQKTAWKLGHAIRELMDDRDEITGRLTGVVEVDEAIVGGKPKFRISVKSNRGRGTGKPVALVAAARNGHARAILIPNAKRKTNETARQYADPRTGAHIETVEAVNDVVQRALIGVYHRLGRRRRAIRRRVWVSFRVRGTRDRRSKGADSRPPM